MFFIKLDIKFDNGSCYLIVHVRACLGCRGGQGRGRLSVMVGVVGGILLSSCPLASLSCPPSLSPLSLSLSLSLPLVWISCLVRSRQPRWEQWELFRGGVTRLCYHQMGTQKCQPPKQIVETISCSSLRVVRVEHCQIKTNTMPPQKT